MTAFAYSRTKPEIWPESNCALTTVADDNINSATTDESLIARLSTDESLIARLSLIDVSLGGNLEGEHIPTSSWLKNQIGCRGRAGPQRLLEKNFWQITK